MPAAASKLRRVTDPTASGTLARQLGLVGLAATGICSMMGAAINVVPLMLQRNVPGIGPWVLPAFMMAIVPALFAATAYASLASGVPRAGGSYLYASRSLNPYVGFVASFSQWFGLCIAIGVVSYLIVPFLRDLALAGGRQGLAEAMMTGPVRLTIALGFLWLFTAVNLRGIRAYERTLVPLMILMFAGGAVVIVAGFANDHDTFAAAVLARDGTVVPTTGDSPFRLSTFMAASVILFSSFIGFDSIAQAGGEARNPSRNLPLAIGIAIVGVGTFYMLFAAAMYHTVPWPYVAERALTEDLTAPGLLGYLLPPAATMAIVAGAAIALINDLPAMLLAVSRLVFAWAEDGVFPRAAMAVHPRRHTPDIAIIGSACMASAGILGSHFAGDFFLGVDILVTSMLVNFLVVALSLAAVDRSNPAIAREIRFLTRPATRRAVGVIGAALLAVYLVAHVWKDLAAPGDAWYLRSTWLWLIVMAASSMIFWWHWRGLSAEQRSEFVRLPPQ